MARQFKGHICGEKRMRIEFFCDQLDPNEILDIWYYNGTCELIDRARVYFRRVGTPPKLVDGKRWED